MLDVNDLLAELLAEFVFDAGNAVWREVFELPLPLRADRFSKPARSAAPPPLRERGSISWGTGASKVSGKGARARRHIARGANEDN
jgi:hypothetical protein